MTRHQSETRKVVVKFTPEMLENKSKEFNAARIRELGLTSYGNTRIEAIKGLERLFYMFVTRHRDQCTLQKVLDRSTLEWCWADEYVGAPYTDVTPGQVAEFKESTSQSGSWTMTSSPPLGLAA